MDKLEGKKTYIGLAITAIVTLGSFIGIEILETDVQQFVENVVALLGIIIAAYGRAVTKG